MKQQLSPADVEWFRKQVQDIRGVWTEDIVRLLESHDALEERVKALEAERAEHSCDAPWRVVHGLYDGLQANGQPVDVAVRERMGERDAAQAQLRVCVSALQDEADMLEQWLQQSAPGPDVVQRRAQMLRRIADVARKALP